MRSLVLHSRFQKETKIASIIIVSALLFGIPSLCYCNLLSHSFFTPLCSGTNGFNYFPTITTKSLSWSVCYVISQFNTYSQARFFAPKLIIILHWIEFSMYWLSYLHDWIWMWCFLLFNLPPFFFRPIDHISNLCGIYTPLH